MWYTVVMGKTIGTAIIEILLIGAHPSRALNSLTNEVLQKRVKPNSLYTALDRLEKQRFINLNNNTWHVTHAGRNWYSKKKERWTPDFLDSPFQRQSKKDLLVIFDIPEKYKHKREWLREQLKIFGYEMIQRSVWVGPSPLPHSFMNVIHELKIDTHVRKFKIRSN